MEKSNHYSIGFAIAQRFASEGAKVVISSRKPENVTNAVNKLKTAGHKNVIGVKCHVSNAEDRKQLFNEAIKNFGRIDILVSNAAVNPTVGPVSDCTEEAWDKIFDVNVKSSFLLAKEAIPHLRKQSKGSIIFMSSYGGVNPFPVSGDVINIEQRTKTYPPNESPNLCHGFLVAWSLFS